ncbi:MAG: hypothetical protein WCI50_07040, partial [Actinomycetes bacterium]
MTAPGPRQWHAPAALGLAAISTVGALLVHGREGSPSSPFVALASFAGVAYLVMLVAQRRGGGLRLRQVVVATATVAVVAVALVPRVSSDVWMYAVYGRLAARHLDPWVTFPRV